MRLKYEKINMSGSILDSIFDLFAIKDPNNWKKLHPAYDIFWYSIYYENSKRHTNYTLRSPSQYEGTTKTNSFAILIKLELQPIGKISKDGQRDGFDWRTDETFSYVQNYLRWSILHGNDEKESSSKSSSCKI